MQNKVKKIQKLDDLLKISLPRLRFIPENALKLSKNSIHYEDWSIVNWETVPGEAKVIKTRMLLTR